MDREEEEDSKEGAEVITSICESLPRGFRSLLWQFGPNPFTPYPLEPPCPSPLLHRPCGGQTLLLGASGAGRGPDAQKARSEGLVPGRGHSSLGATGCSRGCCIPEGLKILILS